MMRPHHVGVAVRSIQEALETHRRLFKDYEGAVPFEDPIQQVRGLFVPMLSGFLFEFLEPSSDESHLNRLIDRNAGAYHIGYEVDGFDAEIAALKKQGWVPTGPAQPAVAFQGRRIIFLFSPEGLLIELIEGARHE